MGFVLASNLIVDSRDLSVEGDLVGTVVVGRIGANFADMRIALHAELAVDIVRFGMNQIAAF